MRGTASCVMSVYRFLSIRLAATRSGALYEARAFASLGVLTTSSSSTHVSLLPPPCELLTTRLPFRKATRVSPPGITTTFSPYRM